MLEWTGDATRKAVVDGILEGLTNFGLHHESVAKGLPRPGRGLLTGTYRRSIHAADTKYRFENDDVRGSVASPERGGSGKAGLVGKSAVAVVVGSGLVYAIPLERKFQFIRQSFDTASNRLPEFLETAVSKRLE